MSEINNKIEIKQKYPTYPWHILDPDKPKVNSKIRDQRLNICLQCEFLANYTKVCKKCKCYMPVKTKLEQAYCPVDKW